MLMAAILIRYTFRLLLLPRSFFTMLPPLAFEASLALFMRMMLRAT